MATAAGGGYEGGAGGKFRKRPFRRQTTPYDRPVSVLSNPGQGGNNGWLSKIVDPASRVITRSAQRFFSSVFRKRLTAPERVSADTDREPSTEPSEPVSTNPCGVQEPVANGNDDVNNHSDNSGIGKLEQILRQKTFTRAEIDRLTELLYSKTVDMPVKDDKKKSEPSTSQLVAYNHDLELSNVPVQENGVDAQRLLRESSTPVVLEEDIASPAELAKAYMGNRTSKVSPSTLGLRSLRGELPLPCNVPFPRKSSGMSLVPRSSVRSAGIPGVSENGFQTPRSRGRSAIYNMARTPYSRIQHTAKGIRDTDRYAGPSSSPWMLEDGTVSTGKQVSKRRSSVLDDDIGSIGPIRKIRQKTNLMSPKSIGSEAPETPVATRGTAFGSDVAQSSVSLTQKSLPLEEPKHTTPKMRIAENVRNGIRGMSSAAGPSQTSDMAQRIFQQLDKLVPSPKEKSSELKLATAVEKSSATLPVVQDSDDWLKMVTSGNKLFPEANGPDRNTLRKDVVPISRTADSAVANSVVIAPQKNQAFRMNSHEVSLELDDNRCSNKVVHTVNGEERPDDTTLRNRAASVETVAMEKPSVSETKTSASSKWNKSSGAGASDGPKVDEKVTSLPSTVAQLAPPCQSPSLLGNVVPAKGTASPVFNFGSKAIDNAPPFKFSSVSSSSEASGLKLDSQLGLELKTSSSPSANGIGATATGIITKAAVSDKVGKENALKNGDVFRKHEDAIFSSGSTSLTPNVFFCSNSTNNSNLSNGSAAPSTSFFSVPASPSVPASTVSSNVSFMSGRATTSSSNTSVSAASSALSSVPVFQFGSGSATAVAPVSSMSLPSTSGAELTELERKVVKAPSLDTLSPLPFGSTSSSTANTSSGTFGLSNLTPASTTNSSLSANLSSNHFGAGNVPLFGSKAASGTAASPTFNLSTSSTFSSGGSLSGFSTSVSKLFSSGSGFGQNASPATFSTGANHFSSASLFNLSVPSESSVISPAISSASSSATGFFCGGSSTAGAATGSAPSPATVFSFGGSSAAAICSASPATVFPLGGSSTTAAAAAGSASPAIGFSFGGSSAAGATTAASPATTGLSFGGSLTAGATTVAASPATIGFSYGGSSTAGATAIAASPAATEFSFGGSSIAGATTIAASPATTGFSFVGSSSTAGATNIVASPATSGFSFGGSLTAGSATGTAPLGFGSSIGASSGSVFPSTSASAANSSASLNASQPLFGLPSSSITFGSSCPANDQMNREDSMAEDTVHASTATVLPSGQPAAAPSPGFMFNAAPSGSPFQFGAQQNLATPQNPSPFQVSGNSNSALGGGFSLGSADKSNRKFFRAKRKPMRK